MLICTCPSCVWPSGAFLPASHGSSHCDAQNQQAWQDRTRVTHPKTCADTSNTYLPVVTAHGRCWCSQLCVACMLVCVNAASSKKVHWFPCCAILQVEAKWQRWYLAGSRQMAELFPLSASVLAQPQWCLGQTDLFAHLSMELLCHVPGTERIQKC